MAENIINIKRQLRSVKSTKKLTNATELVATAKLQKLRSKMEKNNNFAEYIKKILDSALACKKDDEEETNPFLTLSDVQNPLHIIITSNSGMCGAYNLEIIKYVKEHINKDEPIFAIGTYGIKYLMANDYLVIKQIDELDDFKPYIINSIIGDIMLLYANNEISSIDIIYTEYINTLKFEPTIYNLLPYVPDRENAHKDIILEPNRDEVINEVVPLYVSSMVYSKILQAKTAENGSRRAAMDAANKNADELIDVLKLKYNQARQAAITQEMNEIVSGSLK